MYGVELDYALNCVLRMLEIFSRGREPEVEGDDSRVVVVAIRKRETAIYLKRWRRRWRKPVNVVTPYKECVPAAGVSMACTQTLRFDFTQG